MMYWWGIRLQNILTERGWRLDWFHDYVRGFLVFILLLVGGILLRLIRRKWLWKFYLEDSILEFVWTCFPVVVLLFIGVPSMVILYSHELERERDLSVKVIGHQWYWSYDYSDFEGVDFDSYIKPLRDLNLGDFRLLEVDNSVVLPLNRRVRFVITRADVLHSWTIPGFGLKVDANPSRLNLIQTDLNSVGLFYGQCREICGANHSFMPICVEVTSISLFKTWLGSFVVW